MASVSTPQTLQDCIQERELTTSDKVYLGLFILVSASSMLLPHLQSYAIAGLMLWWIGKERFRLSITDFYGLPLAMLVFYALHAIGALYSQNDYNTSYDLQTKASMVVFPLLAGVMSRLTRMQTQQILAAFVAAVAIGSAASLALGAYDYSQTDDIKFLFYHHLAGQVGMHAIYMSMYVCFAILIVLQWLVSVWDKHGSLWTQVGLLALVLFLFAYNVALSARMPTLALCIVVFLGILKVFYDRRGFIKGVGLMALLAGMLVSGVYLSPVNRQRYAEAVDSQSTESARKGEDGRTLRLQQWDCSFSILKTYWLTGVGIGDIQDHLNACYAEKHYDYMLKDNGKFNAHNQYLQTWLGVGIAGLLSLISMLAVMFYKAWRQKHYLLAGFTFMFMLVSVTESTLPTHKGAVYFAFFALLLAQAPIAWPWKQQQNLGTE